MAVVNRPVGRNTRAAATGVTLAIAAAPSSATAQDEVTTQQTPFDRIQIEQSLAIYSTDLNFPGRNIAAPWTALPVFDVNGILIKGRDAIKAMYNKDNGSGGGPSASRINMVTTNPVICSKGDTAIADGIFSGFSDPLDPISHLFEQGHEYTEFVEQSGRWMTRRRAIISDEGLPKNFAKSLPKQ